MKYDGLCCTIQADAGWTPKLYLALLRQAPVCSHQD